MAEITRAPLGEAERDALRKEVMAEVKMFKEEGSKMNKEKKSK